MNGWRIGLVAAALVFLPAAARAAETVAVPAAERQAVTVYQNDLGQIAEIREAALGATGPFRLSLGGIAATAVAGSAQFAAEGLDPRRMVYRLRPLSEQLILERSVGRSVTLVRAHPETGAEAGEAATIVALDDGRPILDVGGRIETDPPGRIVFGPLDADLTDRPAIDVFGHVLAPGGRNVDFRYLADGLDWRSSYVLTLGGGEARPTLDVLGWAMVENRTGRGFRAAPLRLVAGEIDRVSSGGQPRDMAADARMLSMAMEAAPEFASGPAREASNDAHVYTVAGSVDLPAGGPTQIELLTRAAIPVERQYVLEGSGHSFRQPNQRFGQFENPAIELAFVNDGPEPLPSGTARLYEAVASAGRLLGEAAIPPTPAGGRVRLRTGRAFDIRAARMQTNFKRLGPPDNAIETSHEIRLVNAKNADVEITVRESIGGDWEIEDESHAHRRDGLAAVWRVPTPANGEATLRYTVRVRR